MKNHLRSIVLTLAIGMLMATLAACTGMVRPPTPEMEATTSTSVQTACAGATAALAVLTEAKVQGKLTASQAATISLAGHRLLPVCGATAQPTVTDLEMIAFESAVAFLGLQVGALR